MNGIGQRGWLIALVCAPAFVGAAFAAESLRRIKGNEINARFTGMELTDDVHWAHVFKAAGRVESFSMGKASTGSWRVEKDELCLNMGARGQRCYEVWVSGKNVQLRHPGTDLADEGVLQKPRSRSR
jgi:hypothetical protein